MLMRKTLVSELMKKQAAALMMVARYRRARAGRCAAGGSARVQREWFFSPKACDAPRTPPYARRYPLMGDAQRGTRWLFTMSAGEERDNVPTFPARKQARSRSEAGASRHELQVVRAGVYVFV